MNLKHILLIFVVFGLFSGCSDKSDVSDDLKKKQDVISSEVRSISDMQNNERKIIEQCNGKMQCVCDSIPDIRSYSYDGEIISCNRDINLDNNHVHDKLNEEKKSVQEKFNKQAQCLKSQKVDILKDSVRFKFVFDSCWVEYMQHTK